MATIQLAKQYNRDLTKIFPTQKDYSTDNLKNLAFDKAKQFILNELYAKGVEPEQIVKQLLEIAYGINNDIANVKNPNEFHKPELQSQVTSIQQLAKNEKTQTGKYFHDVLSRITSKTMPRGFQKLLGMVFILQLVKHCDRNEKFNFIKFKQWIEKINPEIASHLDSNYFKDFSEIGPLWNSTYQLGNKDGGYSITISRGKLLSPVLGSTRSESDPLLPINEADIKKIVSKKSGYEAFVADLTADMQTLNEAKSKLIIGDLDGDIVRLVLALALTGKITHIAKSGMAVLSELIKLNEPYYKGKRDDDQLKHIQMQQTFLIPSLLSSLTYTKSDKQIIFMGDIFFDRLSNLTGLMEIIQAVHQDNPESVRFIAGNHELFGLTDLTKERKLDRGIYSYRYLNREQYSKFINEHFDFVYFDKDAQIVYSHAMFDVGDQNSNSLKYLDLEFEFEPRVTDKVTYFKQMNEQLKKRFMSDVSESQDKNPANSLTKQGRLAEYAYLIKFAKVKYLLQLLGIRSAFGHDGENFISDNLICTNHGMDGNGKISDSRIGYRIISAEALAQAEQINTGSQKLDELAKEINNAYTEDADLLKGLLQDDKFQDIEIIYLGSSSDRDPAKDDEKNSFEVVLKAADGTTKPLILQEANSAASKEMLKDFIAQKAKLEVKVRELADKKPRDFIAALTFFLLEQVDFLPDNYNKHSCSVEENWVVISNRRYNFTQRLQIPHSVSITEVNKLIEQYKSLRNLAIEFNKFQVEENYLAAYKTLQKRKKDGFKLIQVIHNDNEGKLVKIGDEVEYTKDIKQQPYCIAIDKVRVSVSMATLYTDHFYPYAKTFSLLDKAISDKKPIDGFVAKLEEAGFEVNEEEGDLKIGKKLLPSNPKAALVYTRKLPISLR
ncbi:MAG: hypothetical protein ACK4M7_00280 [Burkholderiales bacterium]